jgi:hypothetical protein
MNFQISKDRCMRLATLGEPYDIAAGGNSNQTQKDKTMNTITRDDTIHGVEYVTKQEAERELAELNERLIDRQETLMETLIENQNLRRELDKAMHYNQ